MNGTSRLRHTAAKPSEIPDKLPDDRIAKFSRTATNPLTWLRAQVEAARNISPITRIHIRRMFARLGKKYGRIDLLDDAAAEQQAALIAHRLNWMRSQEHLLNMKPGDSGYLNVQKAFQIAASGAAKLNIGKKKRPESDTGRQPVVTARLAQPETGEDEPEEADADTA